MKKWDPQRMERATRSMVGRAIALEEFEGRGPVYLDATHLNDAAFSRIEKCIPSEIRAIADNGLDLRKDKIAFTVGLEDLNPGGIRVNRNNRTTLSGLYAAGAATDHAELGVTELITPGMASAIGGYRAGEAAARSAAENKQPAIKESQIRLLKENIFVWI